MTSPLTIQLPDEDATRQLGARLGKLLPDGAVVALNGPLGAGKTRLVQGLAGAIGLDPREVVSPTFTLVQEHRGARTLYHFDAYRLRDDDEFLLFADRLLAIQARRLAGGRPRAPSSTSAPASAPTGEDLLGRR